MKKTKLVTEPENFDDEAPLLPGDVTVTGTYPTLLRKKTGLFSLDYALQSKGYLGLPMRNLIELYGYVGVGKSTLAYYLAGKVSERDTISICDIEMLDREYIPYAIGASGFKGNVHLVDGVDDKQKAVPHENMMMNMVKELAEETTGASILDSVSAIQPIAEAEGDFGEAFMGKRAKLVGQVSRALSGVLRNKERPSSAFIINHVYQILGGRGHTTAGGVLLGALAGVRLMLWTGEAFYDDKTGKPLGFLVKGKVEKLRFGGKGGEFQFYIVPGFGIHVGVSAMFDCFEFELAERGTRVKLDDRNIGYLKTDLLSYAALGKTRKFLPFIDKLNEYADKVEKGNE